MHRNSDLTIHQLIEEYAEKAPDHIAVIDQGSSYSYSLLNQKANQLAHYLQRFELQPDTSIAISIDRSGELIIAILGILKAGCAYLPLDAEHPESRLQYIFEDSKAPILITLSKSKDKFSGYTGRVLLLDQLAHEMESAQHINSAYSVCSNNLAYVIYTSGSTGRPKGVMVEHRSVVNYIKWFSAYSKCRQQSRVDFSSNIIFDMAVTTTITALALGLQIVICSDAIKKDVRQYLLHLNKNKINLVKFAPSYFNVLIQEVKKNAVALPDLQYIILGGEILHTKDCGAWLETYPQHILINEYGPTEATVAVTEYKVTRDNITHLGKIVPIGKPGLNIDCQILNDNKQSIEIGKLGELYIGGACLARGYLNQAELTARQFIQGQFYKTGDLCRYLPDGNIEFVERIDDQVKIRGYRIEPGEIEANLASHPLIKEICVVPRENSSGEKQLVAYYIPNNASHTPSKDELRIFLQQKLADYMIPATFVMMKLFPLTENGKLDKKALPDPLHAEEIIAPSTQIEGQLVAIWQKAFHLNKISIKSNFFELGGHSLIATRIIAEIQNRTGKKIQLQDLYQAPTIHELAKIIAAAESSSDESAPLITSSADTNTIPLTDFQFMFWIANLFEPKFKRLNIIARRRISGKLEIEALSYALQCVINRHEILSYQMSTFIPRQYLKANIKSHILVCDLSACSELERELKLGASLDELIGHKNWRSDMPFIIVKLFHLNNEMSEVQICVRHIDFDDASEAVLFAELSTGYLNYIKGLRSLPSDKNLQFADYVIYEKNHINQHLDRDIAFWQKYLNDTALVTFPSSEVIQSMGEIPYSTYLDLSEELINNILHICTNASISITDFLCAALTLALKKTAQQLNNKIFINVVRSIRDNEIHDQMIGCFLRLDSIKLDVNTNLHIIDLAKAIQQSRIETEPYQDCGGMVKLACLDKSYRKKPIYNFFVRLISSLYSKLVPGLKINPKLLTMYTRLNSLRTKQQFLININLLNNFLSNEHETTLFGMKLEKAMTHRYDLTTIDHVLDISFTRNESLNQAYLVLSTNLKPAFRQRLGEEMIKAINDCNQLPLKNAETS